MIFRNVNFMTPHWLGYYKGKVRGRVAYIELSQGDGIFGGQIYGVTFRRPNGQELWREPEEWDPSGCFNRLENALATIREFGGRKLMKERGTL